MSINNMSFDMASTVKTSTDVVLKVEHVAKCLFPRSTVPNLARSQ